MVFAMFYIDIKGNVKGKDVIYNYVYDTLMHFFRKEPKRDIDITVNFVKQCDGNHSGLCDGDHDEVNIDIAKGSTWDGEYILYSFEDMMVALAHELVHAKQYLKKELSPWQTGWKKDYRDYSKLDYHELPWEKEAFSLENKLFETYWRTR